VESEGVVIMTLTDDGKGFDMKAYANHPNSWGLVMMRERALGIGAKFKVESAPGGGTTVRVEWNQEWVLPK